MTPNNHDTEQKEKHALLIGASSTIAQAVIARLIADDYQVIAVSRGASGTSSKNIKWLTCDYSQNSIQATLKEIEHELPLLDQVMVFNGTLHNESTQPEKQLSQLTSDHFHHSMEVNALLPIKWIQDIYKKLTRKKPLTITAFSARVGSIEDNGLGGWYSYRASKSALNMLLKTFSAELHRTHPVAKIVLFHPGTTDTNLSKPFQKNVPSHKLFKPDFVAERLLSITKDESRTEVISYLDWDNKPIPW